MASLTFACRSGALARTPPGGLLLGLPVACLHLPLAALAQGGRRLERIKAARAITLAVAAIQTAGVREWCCSTAVRCMPARATAAC
jgi:hypothetical protein